MSCADRGTGDGVPLQAPGAEGTLSIEGDRALAEGFVPQFVLPREAGTKG
ncbi:hypothetical protein [Allosphingosinicella deserti]|nr:hypothetical protein [Sphingomonas deserti]